jgi:hypothetical protein
MEVFTAHKPQAARGWDWRGARVKPEKRFHRWRAVASRGVGACGGAGISVAPDGQWGMAPFFVEVQPRCDGQAGARFDLGARFDFDAPTTARNAARVLRAMQLRQAVLLEGSPGVGKTSLVAALAKATGALPPPPQKKTLDPRP